MNAYLAAMVPQHNERDATFLQCCRQALLRHIFVMYLYVSCFRLAQKILVYQFDYVLFILFPNTINKQGVATTDTDIGSETASMRRQRLLTYFSYWDRVGHERAKRWPENAGSYSEVPQESTSLYTSSWNPKHPIILPLVLTNFKNHFFIFFLFNAIKNKAEYVNLIINFGT